MTNRCWAIPWLACAALGALGVGTSLAAAQGLGVLGGAGPADPPPEFRDPVPFPADVPSVVKGEKAGIEVGQCAPDFQLQLIQPYAILETWLGKDGPKNFEQAVPLSQLVGKVPVMLLFGSYT